MGMRAMVTDFARQLLGNSSLVALDVGAARGLLPHWEPLAPIARLYLFEPDPQAVPLVRERVAALGASDAHVLPYGLSEDGGSKKLHQLATRSSSSLLPLDLPDALDFRHNDWVFPQSDLVIETRTLASVLDEVGADHVDMIKLDTQGTELSILRGMGARARTLLSLEIEVGTASGYAGQATLADVLTFADAQGLELYDLVTKRASMIHAGTPGYYERLFGTYRNSPSSGTRLVEVDALFMRKRALLLDEGGADAIRRSAVVLALHGRYAQAHRLVELAKDRNIFTPEEFRQMERVLVEWHKRAYVRRVAVDIAEKVVQKVGERVAPLRQ